LKTVTALSVLALLAAPLSAAEPGIRALNVRGLQVGEKTTLILDGDDLGTSPKLLLPFPATQTLLPKNTPKQATFEVTANAAVVPGFYPMAVVTDQGASAPVAVAVDKLPQRPFAASVDQIPVALHGTLTGGTASEVTFPGRAGQKVTVEVEAQRLGGKLRPILTLTTAKRLQLAWAWPSNAHGGDAKLEATLPADGPYTVALHDVEYAGQAPGHFRLKIGQWAAAEPVFPPVIAGGTAKPGERFLPLDWKDGSGPRPFVTVSPHAEIVELPTAKDGQQLPAGPVGVCGRLLTDFEEDRYRVPVMPLAKVRLEVFADRLGSPVDAALIVRDAMGKELSRTEDGPGTVDPVVEYAVPAGVTNIIVGVVDAQGRGKPNGVYRLVIDSPKSGPHLLTPENHLSVPAGGRFVIPVIVDRRGDTGKFDVTASTLPAGVTLENTAIPENADGTLVVVRRTDAAAEPAFVRFRGARGEPVTVRNHPLDRVQPWLAGEMPLALSAAKAADFQIDWNNLPPDAGIVPAGKLNLPVKLTRVDAKSPVRLTLVTSQFVPLVNNLPDVNQSLRAEKPVELATAVNDGVLTMLAPPLLNSPVYDVTVQADLLAADKKTVLATAFAPVRRMAVRLPIVVTLDGPAKIDATAGAPLKLAGKVERKEGATGDVTVTLVGLPPGVTAAPVVVKAGETAFTLNVVVPATTAGEFKDVKLSATVVPDPKLPAVRVKGKDVDVTLVVKAAAKK